MRFCSTSTANEPNDRVSYEARHIFRDLPYAVAVRLSRELVRIAQGEPSGAEKIPDSRLFQVRVRGALALFAADRGTTTIYVLHVYRQ